MDHSSFPVTPDRLLVLCRANVCRSALAEFRLNRALERSGGHDGIEIVSAGTDARPGSPICADVAARISREEGGALFANSHASMALTDELIASSALVITMTARQRGIVARMLPGSQHKTFTLHEAVALASVVGDGITGLDSLEAVAARLHGARWRAARSVEDDTIEGLPVDVFDGHSHRSRDHRRTIAAVHSAADTLGVSLGRLVPRSVAA
ncbi:hypothetical protein [Herbiconiux sp. L3-i23]|uniref:arsenate reductase/protein-tyrosine-phosphatase family protein n=1 Tax=Herbiconiux sp. L3-i23 TaxID=2905871 RepID=UPI002069F7FA|nr:hypothetical protein [Herbiconiux sp. L3-i23]BDI21652.1 protein-tyrosine-phosphatase [Herbiconiux sp. L3-i23]